jgi:energy-coupling factor transporter ATP-binding protein EcfA2
MDAIEVKGFSWKYALSRDWVLKDINLTVHRGEFLGIVGPSGSGKTTLCLSLTGLIPNLTRGTISGSISVDGLDTQKSRLPELIRKVGVVFQDPESQFVTMSVEDEIAFPLENFGYPVSEMISRISNAMELTRLSGLKEKYPHELSGGQKQRVAIASFLALRPGILILDEPTSDLDPVGKSEVFSVLADLKKHENITLVVVEHNTEEMCRYADRIVLLNSGQIERAGEPEEFFSAVDELKGAGVYPPQVTELAYGLKELTPSRPFPITLEHADFFKKIRIPEIATAIGDGSQKSPEQSERVVVIENLKHTYPDGTQALQGISLVFHRGEYVALIGQNASGKTTLVKHIVGLLKPTEGHVEVFNVNTGKTSVAELAKRVGFVYQNPDHQLFCKTTFEECAYGLVNQGLEEDEVHTRVSRVLKIVGLDGLEDTETFLLGKGQRTRLAVAATLVMEPELIIVDEPTTGQDMKQAEGIMGLLDQLNHDGKTIIIITHNMRLVAEHTKRAVVMLNGKIVADGPVREVFSQTKLLHEAYLAPPQITTLGEILYPQGPRFLTVAELQAALLGTN